MLQGDVTKSHKCSSVPSTDLKPVIGSIKTYLGRPRPWKKYLRTVVLQSLIGNHIDPTGWSDASKDFLQTLYYREYMNSGPGAGIAKRVNWPGYHIIKNAAEASKFTVTQFIQGNVWLKNTGLAFIAGLLKWALASTY
ncbi:pectinesterase [Trifolium repens]|nr:pectinesterase/pectinesterase inhibitor PPE8B [Trifolium repens]WJX76031.1 pectinesterase [Trifolium repens]